MRKQDRIAYLNARLVDPASGLDEMGALLTEGDQIVDLGPNLFKKGAPSVDQRVDCQGHVLAPGLIDARVHCPDIGMSLEQDNTAGQKDGVTSIGHAALSGGITSIIQLPDTDPVTDSPTIVDSVWRRRQSVKGPALYVIAAATRGLQGEEITEIGLLSEAGAVAFGDSKRAISSPKLMRRLLSYGSAHEALIVQPALEPELGWGGVMNSGELATRLGLSGSPGVAETLAIERDCRLLDSMGPAISSDGRGLHFSLVSTSGAIEALATAKANGLKVTADTAPHYFLLNELSVLDYRTFAKVMPPLRHENDRLAVVEALKNGVIDMVVSDHSPQDQDSKRLPFAQAEFGVTGLETLLAGVLNLYQSEVLSLLEALALVTCNPARRFRLPAGQLAPGAPADLVLIDLDHAFVVKEDELTGKSKNTAFGGLMLQGRALRTVRAGECLYKRVK